VLNVGLTGGIGCGKSTVARMLRSKGAYVIDFDLLAHAVEATGEPAWIEIVDYFGTGILNADRTINRERLGTVVFADPEKMQKLNGIVHPAVFAAWRRRISEIEKEKADAIVISDVPLLIEVEMQPLFDLVILVYIHPDKQIRRIMERNSLSLEKAQGRLACQMPIDDKIPHADMIINNEGSIEKTEKIIDGVWEALVEKQKRKYAEK
jgi:dephospho-CoA kinase